MTVETDRPILDRLMVTDDKRLFTVFEAIKKNISIDDIYEITKIDKFFLYKLKKLADYELAIEGKVLDKNRN